MNNTEQILKFLNRLKSDCYAQRVEPQPGQCGLLFDGVLCWLPAFAATTANQSCPNEGIKSTKNGFARRQCTDSVEWNNLTNYTECGGFYTDVEAPPNFEHVTYNKWLPVIKSITHYGYLLSLVSLVVSIFIFIYIKRLHCSRNTLHVNLFFSFVMRASMALIKDVTFIEGTALFYDTVYVNGKPFFDKEDYSWFCKAIISLKNYFIISNYTFLLMEAAYLHNLMFLNIFTESGASIYCLLGWGLPILFIVPWIILRTLYENEYCWTQSRNGYIVTLIDVPIGFAVIVNFVFFVVIMRVLFIKITSMYIQQRRLRYRKLLRSTLILVPLFGIPCTIAFALKYEVYKSQTLEIIWLFFDQTFNAFQGLFVSSVYCLFNSEVQSEIRRLYTIKVKNGREFKRNRTISHTQQIPLYEDCQEPKNDSTKTDCF